jgi:tRNA(fMet)-specific endonuclease VapC
MIQWILDTDHMTHWQRNNPQVIQRIATLDRTQLATTVITLEEQMRGRLSQINQVASGDRLRFAYVALRRTYQLFQDIQICDFTYEAELRYADLIKQRLRVGTQDLRIAAIALSLNATVVTCNVRDFGRVSALLIEDWTLG